MKLKDCAPEGGEDCEYKESVENNEETECEMVAVPVAIPLPKNLYSNALATYKLAGANGEYKKKSGGTFQLQFHELRECKTKKDIRFYVYKVNDWNVKFAFSDKSFKTRSGNDRYYLYRQDGNKPWKRILTHGGTSRKALSDN
jgi:hypothetical protein